MEQEKVIAAACKISTDENIFILTAERHADVREILYCANIKYNNITDGFWTDKDRFVNRIEAKKIAVAANQLIVPIEETYPELYSEDVW
jgi:hypothetical protein